MCLHLFSDSEAHHEQMGPIPTSDKTLSKVHTWSSRQHTFQTIGATELELEIKTELLVFAFISQLTH